MPQWYVDVITGAVKRKQRRETVKTVAIGTLGIVFFLLAAGPLYGIMR